MKKIHLSIGHIGLLDAAPLLVARERGYFEAEGLSVSLSCELGLATVFGKLSESRLDGACLPVQMPFLLSVGASVPRVSMRASMVTSYQGTGIVITKARYTSRVGGPALRIGTVAPGTSARLFLVVASQLMDFFRDGMFDGFCGIDPLPSLAGLRSDVVRIASSADLFPMHPGGVAALRTEVVERYPELSAAWTRALTRACEVCADPAEYAEIWNLVLSQGPYMELDSDSRKALAHPLDEYTASSSSIRFTNTQKGMARMEDPDAFIDASCRSALGPSMRNFDIKSEIARVYSLKSQQLAVGAR
jgi:ABC-type nitrate/sulfonate/bicarbonate transport system substrate-binding protein